MIIDIRKERDRLTKRISRMQHKADNDEVDEIDALEDLSNWKGWRDALSWVLAMNRKEQNKRRADPASLS